jgi:CRISPR/Cas system CSM-associated protein Csm3 (group 7 of RAMP superfamily)
MVVHINKHRHLDDREAVSPYNFVPLPEKVLVIGKETLPDHDRYHQKRHTGYLTLDIKTETPMYTRCAYPTTVWNQAEFRKPDGTLDMAFFDGEKPKPISVRATQDFFHRGTPNLPVIPGSTIRGMTRALVETLAFAKISKNHITDRQLVHRAVADKSSLGVTYRERMMGKNQAESPRMKFEYPLRSLRGGYLVKLKSGYAIRPAIEHLGESFVHFEYGKLERLLTGNQSFECREHQGQRDFGQICSNGNHAKFYKVQHVYEKIGGNDIFIKPVPRTSNHGRSDPKLTLNLAYSDQVSLVPADDLRKAMVVVSGHMSGSARIAEKEIIDLEGLIRALTARGEMGTRFLYDNFRESLKNLLSTDSQSGRRLDRRTVKELTGGLNGILKSMNLKTEEAFRECVQLLENNADLDALRLFARVENGCVNRDVIDRLNRKLLEVLLPQYLKKKRITEKHMHCAIYEPDEKSELIEIPEEMWKVYFDDSEMNRGIKTRKLRRTGDPLFYLVNENKIVFFGPTMMFRLPYLDPSKHLLTTRNFVPAQIWNETGLDLAESIFGTVKDNEQLSGRVFFTDAIYEKGDESTPFFANRTGEANVFVDGSNDGRRIPKILASPKPTAFQLYLMQPEPSGLKSYYNQGETSIRGTKRYWHRRGVKESNERDFVDDNDIRFVDNGKQVEFRRFNRNGNEQWGKSKQHTVVRPVKENVRFKGQVYFENLSAVELGALLSAVQLNVSQRHQLGMGKPYGLGTVQILASVVLQDRRERYLKLLDADSKWANPVADVIEDCREAFERRVLENYNSVVEGTVSSMQQIPRLQELFTMLEWDEAAAFAKNKYRGLEDDADKRMWRDRYVLPLPTFVAGKTPYSVGSLSSGSMTVASRTLQEETEALARSFQHYREAIETLTSSGKDLKQLAKAIVKKFKNKKVEGKALASQLLNRLGPDGLNIEASLQAETSHREWLSQIKQMAK